MERQITGQVKLGRPRAIPDARGLLFIIQSIYMHLWRPRWMQHDVNYTHTHLPLHVSCACISSESREVFDELYQMPHTIVSFLLERGGWEIMQITCRSVGGICTGYVKAGLTNAYCSLHAYIDCDKIYDR